MAEFVMPVLGADMAAGTVVGWRKQPGDQVRRGDIIVEVETDKANIEVESFQSGVLEQVLVGPGEKVPVGTVLALIRAPGEAAAAASPGLPAAPATTATSTAPASAPAPAAPAAEGIRISPVARKLAVKLGVDLAVISGTGPGGRIQERDIEAAAARLQSAAAPAPPAPAPAADAAAERQARMRQAIAAAMSRSNREIPHFYLSTSIDLGRALAWLRTANEGRSVAERLLYVTLLIKATALALHTVPELNATWADGHVELKPDIHIGIATSLRGGGLMAPALRHTDRQTLDELMRNSRDLVQRTRSGGLRSSELTDTTITVTNLGEQGVEAVYGLITPPQVALVGFGKVAERPWAVDGLLGIRPLVTATLAADHRVLDGHRGSVFLNTLDALLQEPEKL